MDVLRVSFVVQRGRSMRMPTPKTVGGWMRLLPGFQRPHHRKRVTLVLHLRVECVKAWKNHPITGPFRPLRAISMDYESVY